MNAKGLLFEARNPRSFNQVSSGGNELALVVDFRLTHLEQPHIVSCLSFTPHVSGN